MMMRKIQMVMTSVLLLGISLPGFAQESQKNEERDRQQNLNREMTLEREYDPIVQDATKVTALPAIREINIIKRPISYSDYAVPLLPDKEMNVLPPDKLMTGIPRTKHNGYLHFGGGMLLNLMGDFGYHILNTDRTRLGVYFSHRSTNGHVKDENNVIDEWINKFNDNLGGLDFKHRFKIATLSLGGKYGHSAFNYYGLPDSLYSYNDIKTNQANQLINGYGSISSSDPAFLGYHIGVDYTNFNQKYSLSQQLDGMTEHHISVDLGLRSRMTEGRAFGVNVKGNFLNYIEPELADIVDSTNFDTHINATLNPYFRLENERVKLLLGVNLMLVSQNDSMNFYASPNITLDVPFASWSVFYANFGGGIESNAMADLSRTNRYVNPAFTPDASKTWADLKIGVRSAAAAGLWFDIFAGYKYTESDVFFNPSSYKWIENGFNNVSMVFQPISQHIQAGATLKYDFQHIFDLYLKGVYNHYTLTYSKTWKNDYAGNGLNQDSELKPYGKPAFVGNAGINVRPVKPLTLTLDYCLMTDLYAYLYLKGNVEMKTINDLRFRTSWKFNDMFSIYAQCNNVLFQQQELYYGYPLQPFSAMAGFNVNF